MSKLEIEALAALAALGCCAPTQAVTAPGVARVAMPLPARCAIVDRDVDFNGLMMASEIPSSALVWSPFAELRHGDRVRVDLAEGKASFVRLDVETTTMRLHGFTMASNVVFHPDSPSFFAGMIVPQARNHLEWRETRADAVLVLPAHEPGSWASVEPEWRPCSYLRLHPRPRFAIRDQLGLHAKRTVKLPDGGYALFSSPHAPGSRIDLFLHGAVVWVLDETEDGWARILWEAGETAFVGWIDRRAGPGPSLGHGTGTGSGTGPPKSCRGFEPMDCDEDLPLFTKAHETMTEIGVVKNGASMRLVPGSGSYSEIETCDPDVNLLEKAFVQSRRALRCHVRNTP